MPRQLRARRRREAGGAVSPRLSKRRLMTGTDTGLPVASEELLTGRITTLVDRLRLRRRG
jgi:hypothetical protein